MRPHSSNCEPRANHPLHGWLGAASMLIGFALAPFLLGMLKPTHRHLDEFALGVGTTSVFESEAGHLVHGSNLDDLDDVITGRAARHAGDVVLWLGNSQLHAINQWHEGDVTAVELARRHLNGTSNLDLIGFSQPNASLQEHYLLFEYLRKKLPIQVLILPLVFDDTRETGIRAGLEPALSDPATAQALSQTAAGRRLLASPKTGTLAGGDFAGLNNTVQDSVERWLNTFLGDHWQLWKDRPRLRGRLFIAAYRTRNQLLNINPSSKRHIIRGRYAANLLALHAILTSARLADIRVITYIAPLRDDAELPYANSEYTMFQEDVADLAHRSSTRLMDLEHLVPAAMWGRKDATNTTGDLELDFMHFQEGGHALLASAIAAAVTNP